MGDQKWVKNANFWGGKPAFFFLFTTPSMSKNCFGHFSAKKKTKLVRSGNPKHLSVEVKGVMVDGVAVVVCAAIKRLRRRVEGWEWLQSVYLVEIRLRNVVFKHF